MKNYINHWKYYAKLKGAVRRFTVDSTYMRTLAGNFKNSKIRTTGKRKKQTQNNMNIILKRLYSRKVHTPILYKGLSRNNAKNFLKSIESKNKGIIKNAFFYTRAPTSTTTNRFQANAFTNVNNKVILVLDRNKRHAIILGHHGIKSRLPSEKEVILPPGKFIFKYKNAKGLYHVNYYANEYKV